MKKQQLLNALMALVNSLRTVDAPYDWGLPHRCNMGLLASVVAKKSPAEIKQWYKDLRPNGNLPTWKNIYDFFCPLTGMSNDEIMRSLQEVGLDRATIINFELLNDPAILAKTVRKVTVKKTGTKVVDVQVPAIKRYGFLWLKKRTITNTVRQEVPNLDVEEVMADIRTNEKGEKDHWYYKKKENVMLYIDAWITILKEELLKEQKNIIQSVDMKHEISLQTFISN